MTFSERACPGQVQVNEIGMSETGRFVSSSAKRAETVADQFLMVCLFILN